MNKIINKQNGETIVEVLIAIAVLGSALGGAFAIVNRSKLTLQTNKERYQAQLFANSQADILKLYSSVEDNRTVLNNSVVDFCFVGAGEMQLYTSGLCDIDDGVIYNVRVKRLIPDFDKFSIKISWDSLTNGAQDQVELDYGI